MGIADTAHSQRTTRSATTTSDTTATRQLDLVLDDARLRGMRPTERRAALQALAQLLLEAAGAAVREAAMTSSDALLPATLLQRKAVVYVRQSTPQQVQSNLESQRRQYELVEVARRRGFSSVEVIDDDLGRSASGAVARPGFDRLPQVSSGSVRRRPARRDYPNPRGNAVDRTTSCNSRVNAWATGFSGAGTIPVTKRAGKTV